MELNAYSYLYSFLETLHQFLFQVQFNPFFMVHITILSLSILQFFFNMWKGNKSWPYLNTDFFFHNPRCFLTLFACIWIFIPFLWNKIEIQYKKLLLLIPIFFVPAFLYANLMESRVYHELNIVLTLALLSGLINSFPSERHGLLRK